MHRLPAVLLPCLLTLACSGADDGSDSGSEPGGSSDDGSGSDLGEAGSATDFPSELLPEDVHSELRLIAPGEGDLVMFTDVVEGIEPGSDVTFCTFTDVILEEPFLYNVGLGSQTATGHHAVLQYTTTPVEPGTRDCDMSEMDGQILMGGTAGKSVGSAIEVPPEIAVEIPAGSQFVINHHYINTTNEVADGQAMMIARAHDDDELILAGQMIMGTIGWQLPPQQATTESTEVVFEDDMEFFMSVGHMHEWGTLVTVEVERGGGGSEMLVDTPWTAELASGEQDYNLFPLDAPFVVNAGDTVRLTCEWQNTTDEVIEFPREMCIFVGYTVDGKNNYAFNGTWIDPDTVDRSQVGH